MPYQKEIIMKFFINFIYIKKDFDVTVYKILFIFDMTEYNQKKEEKIQVAKFYTR